MQATAEMKQSPNAAITPPQEMDISCGSERKPKRTLGILEGKIWMSDDFDEPLEDFKGYM